MSELLVHPDCDPVNTPQYCVVALLLADNFTMDIEKPFRPRPSCMTCLVDSVQTRLLKGVPYLVGYGLQTESKPLRAGTYKAPEKIKQYVDPSKVNCLNC